MKKLLYLLLISVLCVSCWERENSEPGPADAFVGQYEFTNYYSSTMGGDYAGSFTLQGRFTLKKLSANKVKMTGGWSSVGEVVGNTVTFSDEYFSDVIGHINYSFDVATLDGDILRFNYHGTGELKEDGVLTPYTCAGQVTARKLD